MLDQKPLNRLLFLDIETTSLKESCADLTDHQREIFTKRFRKEIDAQVALKFTATMSERKSSPDPTSDGTLKAGKKKKTEPTAEQILQNIKDEVCSDVYNTKAPIHAEFGRILCISVGAIWKNQNEDFYNIKINTFSNEDEKTLLSDFINHEKLGPILNRVAGNYEKNQDDFWALCSHNGLIFDFPYIARRLIINGFNPPAMFDYAHLKPWEQNFLIDSRQVWSFNVFDAAVSLDCLAEIFNIPSSKEVMSGADVKDVFYKEKNLKKIADYCELDVLALVRIYLRMKSMKEDVRLFGAPQSIDAVAELSKILEEELIAANYPNGIDAQDAEKILAGQNVSASQ